MVSPFLKSSIKCLFVTVSTRQFHRNRMTLSFMKSGRSYKKYSLIYLKANRISQRKHLSTTTIKAFYFLTREKRAFQIYMWPISQMYIRFFFLSQKTIKNMWVNFFSRFSLNRPHWADSVIESPCPFVCTSVCLRHRLHLFSRPLNGPEVTWGIIPFNSNKLLTEMVCWNSEGFKMAPLLLKLQQYEEGY